MTICESITNRTIYPVKTSVIERICIEQGLDMNDEYSAEMASDKTYRKAVGSYYRHLSTLPSSVSENGSSFSISAEERKAFANLANEFSGEIKTVYGYKGSRL